MGERSPTNPTPTFKSLERDGYHAQAATYGDRPGRLTRQAIAPMLEAVAAAPGMRLLDLCCGPGYGAGEAAARRLDAVGIDIARMRREDRTSISSRSLADLDGQPAFATQT
jgi:hypothetical protein